MSNISKLDLTIVGGTVCWNQLVRNGNFADTSNWSISDSLSATAANNELTITIDSDAGSSVVRVQQTVPTTIVDHIYLISAEVKSDTLTRIRVYTPTGKSGSTSAVAIGAQYTRYNIVVKATIATNVYQPFRLNNSDAKPVGATATMRNCQFFDLTQTCGADIAQYILDLEAGSGLAWLRKYGFFTKDYYATNAGSLLSVKTSAHKTTNVNITDRSWAGIKKIVSAGLAPKIFKVRDQITCTRNGQTLVWDILGFDCDVAANGNYHTMTLGLHDCFVELQFDPREALFYCEEGLAAGTYNFTVKQHTWVSSDVNKTFQFTLTQAVPAKGQIVLMTTYDVAIAGSTVKTFASATATTEIETATVTEGSAGTSLGDVNNAVNENTNSLQRGLLGSNNYADSPMRQYINSSAAAGSVWTPKTKFNRPPSWAATTAGFLNGMDEDFLSVIGEVTKKTALNTVSDGGGSVETTERFFLLSRSEVYGGDSVTGGEGAAYPYYANYSDLAAPGTGNDSNRIKYRNGSAQYWWLRSPVVGGANNVRRMRYTGDIYYNYAPSSLGVAPACCIVGDSDYDKHSYPLDDDLELRGPLKLDDNNELYYDGDIYESSGKVTRKYGIVDLGTLTWVYDTTLITGIPIFKALISDRSHGNTPLICDKYITYTGSRPNFPNLTIRYQNDTSGSVMIRDDNYTDATTFKSAMSGVYLVYKLATPMEETADPYINPQVVAANGTEEFVDDRDVPMPVGNISKYY